MITLCRSDGTIMNLEALKSEDLAIEEIAHTLSLVNRFGGRTRVPYSVAQHSVHVSRLVPPELAKDALLHDATEAFVGDLCSTIKRRCSDFREIEFTVWEQLAPHFGLYRFVPERVHAADRRALEVERWWLYDMQCEDTAAMWHFAPPVAHPAKARDAFLARYLEVA